MISKKEAKILQAIKDKKIDTSEEFWDANESLIRSLSKQHYITHWHITAKNRVGYLIKREGELALTRYKDEKQQNFLNNLIYPMLVGIISGILGYILGSVLH